MEIHPFDYVVQDFESDDSTETEIPPVTDLEQRVNRIREIVDLQTLNPEEKRAILDLIHDYPDLFLVPGDHLPCTNLVYHEIPLENDIPINTKQYRHPPVHKERLIDQVLRGLQNVEMLVYLDDIIVYAKDLREHDSKVRRLFDCLREARLNLEPEKVHFLRKEVGFLGHIVSQRGMEMDPKKIEVMTNFPQPKTVRNVRQFLGMAGYYRRFIQGFSKIAKPLHDMTKKGVKFKWTPKQETSFQTLKTCLTTAPILIFPDFSKPFTLTTDSSDLPIGAVLSQERDGFDNPIGYLSRVLNKAEVNYSTTEKGSLAALYAIPSWSNLHLSCRS
ncbi:hypothetical protein TKK_0009491 [Trichogramma kaykai]